jgi:hypothetical protein
MTAIFTNKPHRYRTPEFKDPIPDTLVEEDGTRRENPEWTEAEYEEVLVFHPKVLWARDGGKWRGKLDWRNDA